jgi:hypothetical protein
MKKIKTSGIESGTQFGRPTVLVGRVMPTDGVMAGDVLILDQKDNALKLYRPARKGVGKVMPFNAKPTESAQEGMYLLSSADRITKASIDLLRGANNETPRDIARSVRGFLDQHGTPRDYVETPWDAGRIVLSEQNNVGKLHGYIGIVAGTGAIVQEVQGTLANQVQSVMWNAFLSNDADLVSMTLHELCRELGYKTRQDGCYRKEDRERVTRAFRDLMRIELLLFYWLPPRKKSSPERSKWIWGRLWEGTIEGTDGEQIRVNFRPGLWWYDPDWRDRNSHVGLIPREAIALSANDHERIIADLSMYLATLARMDSYGTKDGRQGWTLVKMSTLIEEMGLQKSAAKNAQRTIDRIVTALDTLQERSGKQEDHPFQWEYYRPAGVDHDTFAAQKDRTKSIRVTWPGYMVERGKAIEKARNRHRSTRRRRPAGDAQG